MRSINWNHSLRNGKYMAKGMKSLSFLLLFFLTISAGYSTVPVMLLEQVKPGMLGKGRSVFEGNKIEEFDVEILGILYNAFPKKNIIMAKLKGKAVDQAGVIQGMSGSPVYIEDKLVGAVAYSFPYSREAIAGITPIGEMLNMSQEKEKAPSSFSLSFPFKQRLSLEEIFEIQKDFFASKTSFLSQSRSFVPLPVPLVFSGFSSRTVEKVRPYFQSLGLYPLLGGSSGQALQVSPADYSLQPGEAVGVQLVSGDLNLSAVGTVTHVDGTKVFAFGHPLYNLGPVDYGMTKANVLAIVPSIESSFKLTTAEKLIGRFSQDRTSGALGEIGKMPQFIPINIKILNSDSELKDFRINIVNDKIFSAALVNLSLLSVFSIEERSIGDLTLELEGDIYLDKGDKGMSVHLEDLFSGNFDSSGTNLSGLVAAVVYYLTNNEFKDLGIYRIDLNIRSSEEAKFCYLERIWLDKYEASPGEKIQIKIFARTFRGESLVQEVTLTAPNLPASSEFHLLIGDAASMRQVEVSQYKTQVFVPRSLAQLIRILNNLRKNNRIYFKVMASKPGLFLKGEEMPNLPPTMKSMFASPRLAGTIPTELTKSTLSEYQLPVDFVFKGMAVVPIKIRK